MAITGAFRAAARALAVLAAALLAGCPSYWWTYQNDPRHSGHVAGGMGRSPALRWDVAPGGGGSALTPPVFGAIDDTFRLFIGTGYGDRSLRALSPYTGATLWQFTAPAGNGFMGAPAALGGQVFAATLGLAPAAYALRQDTGALLWSTPLPASGSRASLAVFAGRVYVNTDAHLLHALDQATGAIQWTAATSAGATSQESSPAVGFGKVYVGSDDGLYAFDMLSGAPAWKYTLPAAAGFSSPVLVAGGTPGPLVLIGSADMKVHAVNALTGAGVWTWSSNMSLANISVAHAHGIVFAANLAGAVALDVTSGAVLWTQAFGLPRKSPAIAGRVVFYADDTTVVGLDAASGAPVWKAAIPGSGLVPGNDMAIALERLIVPNRGHVYAFQ